jgi:hypothetical protein
MRAAFTAIDRQLASLIRRRARRRYVIVRLLPASWLEPLLAPRVRRLRIRLIVGAVALCALLVAAILYLAVPA